MNRLFFSIVIGSVLFSSCSSKNNPKQQPGFAGEDISKRVIFTRDKNTKSMSVKINTTGNWSIYSSLSPDQFDFSKPLLKGTGSGVFPLSVPDSCRSYFQVVTAYGKAIMAEKQLPMSGGYNFRDLGGIRTKEGRYTKWGKLFRADELNKLSPEDLQYLASIPLYSIVDFRDQVEIQHAPDKRPVSLKNHYPYSISPGNISETVSALSDMSQLTNKDGDLVMMTLYRMLVTEPEVLDTYRRFFALLQEEENLPLLYHCTAGKDRTGIASALILFSLDVDEQTILDDYLSSNIYLEDKYNRHKMESPFFKSLFEVKSDYLKSAIEEINKEYGSVQNFLTQVLNVDTGRMKALYLY